MSASEDSIKSLIENIAADSFPGELINEDVAGIFEPGIKDQDRDEVNYIKIFEALLESGTASSYDCFVSRLNLNEFHFRKLAEYASNPLQYASQNKGHGAYIVNHLLDMFEWERPTVQDWLTSTPNDNGYSALGRLTQWASPALLRNVFDFFDTNESQGRLLEHVGHVGGGKKLLHIACENNSSESIELVMGLYPEDYYFGKYKDSFECAPIYYLLSRQGDNGDIIQKVIEKYHNQSEAILLESKNELEFSLYNRPRSLKLTPLLQSILYQSIDIVLRLLSELNSAQLGQFSSSISLAFVTWSDFYKFVHEKNPIYASRIVFHLSTKVHKYRAASTMTAGNKMLMHSLLRMDAGEAENLLHLDHFHGFDSRQTMLSLNNPTHMSSFATLALPSEVIPAEEEKHEEDDWFNEAKRLMKAEDVPAALQDDDSQEEALMKRIQLYKYLGQTYFDKGNYDASLGEYSHALMLFEDDDGSLIKAEVLLQLALVHKVKGQLDQAEVLVSQAMLIPAVNEESGRNIYIDLLLLKASLEEKHGRSNLALSYYQEAKGVVRNITQKTPELKLQFADIYTAIGRLHLSAKNFDHAREEFTRAETHYNEIIAQNVSNNDVAMRALMGRASLNFHQGQLRLQVTDPSQAGYEQDLIEAIKDCHASVLQFQALFSNPDNPRLCQAMYQLADLHRRLAAHYHHQLQNSSGDEALLVKQRDSAIGFSRELYKSLVDYDNSFIQRSQADGNPIAENDLFMHLRAILNIAQCDELKGNLQKAADFLMEYVQLYRERYPVISMLLLDHAKYYVTQLDNPALKLDFYYNKAMLLNSFKVYDKAKRCISKAVLHAANADRNTFQLQMLHDALKRRCAENNNRLGDDVAMQIDRANEYRLKLKMSVIDDLYYHELHQGTFPRIETQNIASELPVLIENIYDQVFLRYRDLFNDVHVQLGLTGVSNKDQCFPMAWDLTGYEATLRRSQLLQPENISKKSFKVILGQVCAEEGIDPQLNANTVLTNLVDRGIINMNAENNGFRIMVGNDQIESLLDNDQVNNRIRENRQHIVTTFKRLAAARQCFIDQVRNDEDSGYHVLSSTYDFNCYPASPSAAFKQASRDLNNVSKHIGLTASQLSSDLCQASGLIAQRNTAVKTSYLHSTPPAKSQNPEHSSNFPSVPWYYFDALNKVFESNEAYKLSITLQEDTARESLYDLLLSIADGRMNAASMTTQQISNQALFLGIKQLIKTNCEQKNITIPKNGIDLAVEQIRRQLIAHILHCHHIEDPNYEYDQEVLLDDIAEKGLSHIEVLTRAFKRDIDALKQHARSAGVNVNDIHFPRRVPQAPEIGGGTHDLPEHKNVPEENIRVGGVLVDSSDRIQTYQIYQQIKLKLKQALASQNEQELMDVKELIVDAIRQSENAQTNHPPDSCPDLSWLAWKYMKLQWRYHLADQPPTMKTIQAIDNRTIRHEYVAIRELKRQYHYILVEFTDLQYQAFKLSCQPERRDIQKHVMLSLGVLIIRLRHLLDHCVEYVHLNSDELAFPRSNEFPNEESKEAFDKRILDNNLFAADPVTDNIHAIQDKILEFQSFTMFNEAKSEPEIQDIGWLARFRDISNFVKHIGLLLFEDEDLKRWYDDPDQNDMSELLPYCYGNIKRKYYAEFYKKLEDKLDNAGFSDLETKKDLIRKIAKVYQADDFKDKLKKYVKNQSNQATNNLNNEFIAQIRSELPSMSEVDLGNLFDCIRGDLAAMCTVNFGDNIDAPINIFHTLDVAISAVKEFIELCIVASGHQTQQIISP